NNLKNNRVEGKATTSNSSETKDVQILFGIGFEAVGSWMIENDTIKYKLSKQCVSKKILYSFISEGEVLYIGKTVRSLSQRLYGYMNPVPSQSTNIKNHHKIRKILQQGKEVGILVFAPPENALAYRGIPVNLPAGLEDSLIATIRPLWNNTGKN
ncbi:MAG: hypothetical protein J7K85_06115, partial [Anaerolineaceae bacterium]|nr:hypothetical protein [Anaerolineaceae bacterium]